MAEVCPSGRRSFETTRDGMAKWLVRTAHKGECRRGREDQAARALCVLGAFFRNGPRFGVDGTGLGRARLLPAVAEPLGEEAGFRVREGCMCDRSWLRLQGQGVETSWFQR